MPIVPIKFEKEDSHFDWSDLLTYSANGKFESVKWEELNIEILYESVKDNHWIDIQNIIKNTANFTFYETFGYTIGKFSEFIIIDEPWDYLPDICLNDSKSNVEVTIGELTPLACYIFDIFRDNNIHPTFDECRSIRVYGATADEVELYLLNSMNKIRNKFNFTFNFCSFDDEGVWHEDENEESGLYESNLIMNEELIPNRLLYKGLSENDKTNSFLDFYKILEYYTIINQESEVDNERNDSNVSKRDFVLKMSKLINDKEISLLAKLIPNISDSVLLKYCVDNNLIDNATNDQLSKRLYEFRNSIVHSKLNQSSSPYSNSIFYKDEKLDNWNYVCKELAIKAMSLL